MNWIGYFVPRRPILKNKKLGHKRFPNWYYISYAPLAMFNRTIVESIRLYRNRLLFYNDNIVFVYHLFFYHKSHIYSIFLFSSLSPLLLSFFINYRPFAIKHNHFLRPSIFSFNIIIVINCMLIAILHMYC